jgi:hypothetical protein
MPYLWLPTIDATLKFKTPNGNPEVSAKAGCDLTCVKPAGAGPNRLTSFETPKRRNS